MKRMIDDGMLDTAAKSFIKHYEGENAPTDVPSSENSYFTSIKVAKAKAGARRSINRTIRICAVAAVLMVGLVCALFMGADDDKVVISYTKDAYMFKNFDPDSEWNMPVKVTVDLKEVEKPEWYGEDDILLEGSVVVKDLDGNVLLESNNISRAYDLKWEYFFVDVYRQGIRYAERDDEYMIIPEDLTKVDPYELDFWVVSLYENMESFAISYHEKPSELFEEHPGRRIYNAEDALVIVGEASDRNDAIAKVKENNLFEGFYGSGEFQAQFE